MQLYLDCDGVLADFDKKAIQVFGMHPREFETLHSTGKFWKTITKTPDFFYELEMMEDAHHLYEAVKHLNPIILTGVPGGNWAPAQKIRWVEKMFGPHQTVICCKSAEKYTFCQPGDIIVDDWPKYKQLWEGAGGTFVLHTSAQTSIQELKNLGVL